MAVSRLLKWTFWIVGTLTLLAAAMILLGWWLISGMFGEPSKDEVARLTSPNGRIDAVLFEINGGATTSYGYEVYLVERGIQPSGDPPISLYGATRNDNAYGVNLKWVSPNLLSVEFLSAKSVAITKSTISIGDQVIRLAVHENVADNAAPSGGMLYNLQSGR